MIRQNILVFIGPLGLNTIPKAGDTMKNQMFHERFLSVFDKVIAVDTLNWQKRPWVLLRLMLVLLCHPKAKIVVSANSISANKILRIIRILRPKNDVFYWVIGGLFHKMVEQNVLSIKAYLPLKWVFVEGETMVNSLKESGLNNVKYVPNFKNINHYGVKQPKSDNKTHFVFLSRVEEHKGCSDIISSVDALRQKGFQGKFDVTFYGRESQDQSYAQMFKQMVDKHIDVEYKGLLNLTDTNNYDELAEYDVMLFPTFWKGEGFPGIIIDAYIASLPIIASDWHLNRDLVEEGKTGWIIPPHDVDKLTETMIFAIEHPDVVSTMSKFCREQAKQYDSSVVLSEANLIHWGLL